MKASESARSGEREVLGLDVGRSEDGAFWLQFLRSLVARGLTGVQLVVSDAHQGLRVALGAALKRGELAALPGAFRAQRLGAGAEVGRAARGGDDPDGVRAAGRPKHAGAVATGARSTQRALPAAEADVLAYLAFPSEHWRQIWSNNPLEMASSQRTIAA